MSQESTTNTRIVSDLGKCLLEAARFGNTDKVRSLMSNGAPLITDWLGTTPLHLAAIYGHSSTAEILIKSGISRDCRTKVDKVPLHFACQHSHFEIVKILVNGGAHLDAADMLMMTPLHWAVEANNFDICLLLLKSGVKTMLKNKFDKTPLTIAQDKGYAPIVQLLIDDKFKAVGDTDVTHHSAFVEKSVNSAIHSADFAGHTAWKKPKARRYPMIAGTWTGGEAQNQDRFEISDRGKLGLYKRRLSQRDDLVTPFIHSLLVPSAASETVDLEHCLSALLSPSSIIEGTTTAQNGTADSEGSPLQKLKETVRQSTCLENSSLVTTISSTSQINNTAALSGLSAVTASNMSSTPVTSENTLRFPKMGAFVEDVNQRSLFGNIPVVSSLVLNSLPPDIKAIPLNMTVDDLYKQRSMFQPLTNLPNYCLPVSAPVASNLMAPVVHAVKDLAASKNKSAASVDSHSENVNKMQSCEPSAQFISSVRVTQADEKITTNQTKIQPPINSSTQNTYHDDTQPTIPVSIPVKMLKEIMSGMVTLHSVPVSPKDLEGETETLAGITTEMGTIPLIPVSGEGGLQLIPIQNSPSGKKSKMKTESSEVSSSSDNSTSSKTVKPVAANPAYIHHMVPAQHFMQPSPSPYFFQPQMLPYPYSLAQPNLNMFPSGYHIASAILGDRHPIAKSENGSIPTLSMPAGAPSPLLLPTGMYLQPGHPSYYQLGGAPTLIHPPSYPQYVSNHSQPVFAQTQVPPPFLQQLPAGSQPAILQSHMPRYVYLDPGGAVPQVATPAKVVATVQDLPSATKVM